MTGILALLFIGAALGLIIGVVVKFFGFDPDPRQEAVEGLLPNANCGACGFAGCSAFAEALVKGEAEPGQCPVNSQENSEEICKLLGLTGGLQHPEVALVRCGGDNNKAKQAGKYNGVNDCWDAQLVAGGAKGCLYGCLGLGTCSRACPFDAIEITPQGLAVVHPDLCTGCKTCVPACPRNLITMVPAAAPLHVLCNSPEKGSVTGKVCKVSCIGCRKCVKAAAESETGEMLIDGFLARTNYDNPPSADIADVCPTGCIQKASRQPAGVTTSDASASEPEREVLHG